MDKKHSQFTHKSPLTGNEWFTGYMPGDNMRTEITTLLNYIGASISQFIILYDTDANWASANLTLAEGFILVSADDMVNDPKFKITDGINAWEDLPYFSTKLGLIKIVDLNGDLFTDLTTASAWIRTFINHTVYPITNESFDSGVFNFTVPSGTHVDLNAGFLSNTSASIYDELGLLIEISDNSFSLNSGEVVLKNISFQEYAFASSTGKATLNNITFNGATNFFAYGSTGKFILNGNIGADETANVTDFFTTATATIFAPKEKYTSNVGSINGNLQNAITAGCNVFFDGIDKENVRNKGVADGYVPLNSSAKIDQQYLPSYVDDILEGYLLSNVFYEESTHITVIPASVGKIYIDLTTGQKNKEYRYSGSTYIQISNGLIASTDDVIEGSSNLYFTVSRVLATVLSGLNTALTGVITSSDTILDAFGKIQNSLNLKAPRASPTFTGTVTTPTIIVSGATSHSTPIFNASKEIASSLMVDLSATLTIVGWSIFTTKQITKIDCGSYDIWDIMLDGTSNSATTTVALSNNTNAASSIGYKPITVVDNGGAVSATGVMTLTPSSNLVTFTRNLSQNNFTASGRKLVIAQFTQMK